MRSTFAAADQLLSMDLQCWHPSMRGDGLPPDDRGDSLLRRRADWLRSTSVDFERKVSSASWGTGLVDIAKDSIIPSFVPCTRADLQLRQQASRKRVTLQVRSAGHGVPDSLLLAEPTFRTIIE